MLTFSSPCSAFPSNRAARNQSQVRMHTHAKIFPAQPGSQALSLRHEENKLLFWDSVFKVTVLWGSASLFVSLAFCLTWICIQWSLALPETLRRLKDFYCSDTTSNCIQKCECFIFIFFKSLDCWRSFSHTFFFHSFVQRNAVLSRPSCYRIGSVQRKEPRRMSVEM